MRRRDKVNYHRQNYNQFQIELIEQFVRSGFPREFGEVVAGKLHSEKALYRMKQYLKQAAPASMEEVADELLSLMAEVNNWKEKKVNEYYNGRLNELLRYGLEEDDSNETEKL